MKNKLHTLFFEVTSRCNAHCDHCGSRCESKKKNEVSAENFKKVLDSVAKHYGTKTIMLNITGGEPLIRPDLFEITQYANQLGFKWGLVTNGTLISDEVIKKMKQTQMSTITISIDGMEETHDEFRHMPGSFNKIVCSIKKLVNLSFIEHIQVTFIATKKNIQELAELYSLLCLIGIDSLRISGVDPIGRARDNPQLMLEKEDYEYLFSFMKAHQHSKVPVVWSCTHYFGEKVNPDGQFSCETGISIASVLSNGDIFACPNIARRKELIQGNILEDDFCDIWENRFEFFRNPARTKSKHCDGCKHWENCKGDSFHTFDFDKGVPDFCYRDIFEKENNQIDTNTEEHYLRSILSSLFEKYGPLSMQIIAPKTLKEESKTVIITPTATLEMMLFFHYGENHPTNLYEQQIALIGNQIGEIYLIRFVVPSILYNRSRNMATMDDLTISQTLDEVDIINENLKKSDEKYQLEYGNVRFLGFAHSHPQNTEFRFSIQDSKNQKEFVKRFGDFISILINPQKSKIVSFTGENATQSTLMLLSN